MVEILKLKFIKLFSTKYAPICLFKIFISLKDA